MPRMTSCTAVQVTQLPLIANLRLSLAGIAFALSGLTCVGDLAIIEPGGTPEATDKAIHQAHQYAWELFSFINRQALAGSPGVADPSKANLTQYDTNSDVVWESWALSACGECDYAEVFLSKGMKPPAWEELSTRRAGRRPPFDLKALMEDRTRSNIGSAPPPPAKGTHFEQTNEVRFNRAAFEKIRCDELYSVEGLASAFSNATKAGNPDYIQFPPAAKVIKARWEKLQPYDDPNHFHWRIVDSEKYKLVALHVMTKDLPGWFWIDFIHEDSVPQPPANTLQIYEDPPIAFKGSRWAHYRLTGTQSQFVDARGNPTVLYNPLIEVDIRPPSSCISCHAGAAIKKDGTAWAHDAQILGPPDPNGFGANGVITNLQTDYLLTLTEDPQPKSVHP